MSAGTSAAAGSRWKYHHGMPLIIVTSIVSGPTSASIAGNTSFT